MERLTILSRQKRPTSTKTEAPDINLNGFQQRTDPTP